METSTAARWQTDAHRVLGELLAQGRRAGLPPLTWTLAITGALTAEASVLDVDADPRADLTAWAHHLRVPVTETPRTDGRTSLYAPLEYDGQRIGALRAEIWPDLDES